VSQIEQLAPRFIGCGRKKRDEGEKRDANRPNESAREARKASPVKRTNKTKRTVGGEITIPFIRDENKTWGTLFVLPPFRAHLAMQSLVGRPEGSKAPLRPEARREWIVRAIPQQIPVWLPLLHVQQRLLCKRSANSLVPCTRAHAYIIEAAIAARLGEARLIIGCDLNPRALRHSHDSCAHLSDQHDCRLVVLALA
jgi:hypothetical protein